MRKGRGPNLMPAFCNDCGDLLIWKNHIQYQGRYCIACYRKKKKVQMGFIRKPKTQPPQERTDDSRGTQNL